MSSLKKVFEKIEKYPEKYKAVFEHRPHCAMFGTKNYGDIRNTGDTQYMINPADNDPWDVFAPGYNFKLKLKRRYRIKDVIGVLFLKNGNHKIAIRVNVPGFDEERALKEIELYCTTYMEKVRKKGEWIPFYEKYLY